MEDFVEFGWEDIFTRLGRELRKELSSVKETGGSVSVEFTNPQRSKSSFFYIKHKDKNIEELYWSRGIVSIED